MYYYKKKAVLYKKGSTTPQTVYYAKCLRGADVTLDQISREISSACSLNESDILACLKAFEQFVSYHLLQGNAVKFNTLGGFIPKLKSIACENKEDVDADTIKRVTCRFYPNRTFASTLKSATLEEKDLSSLQA